MLPFCAREIPFLPESAIGGSVVFHASKRAGLTRRDQLLYEYMKAQSDNVGSAPIYMPRKNTYVLGTGLSHDGSACLLKDGEIVVAIEKERITRRKHDGGNDSDAIQYCLDTAGISLSDVALVVQNELYGMFEWGNSEYLGEPRLFRDDVGVPIVTISHHLAHAYNAVGMAPFDEMAILVIDGCGCAYDDAIDKEGTVFPPSVSPDLAHLYFEKESFYVYKHGRITPVLKDFSEIGLVLKSHALYPPVKHSLGHVYGNVSKYCFGDANDLGKLMGLAPYGRAGIYDFEIFECKDGRVFVRHDWMRRFRKPAASPTEFKANFQYYADLAYWTQKELERALLYIVRCRREMANGIPNFAFTGGVALNAVANALIEHDSGFEKFFFTPAAGDNGLAIGCAYYGWLEVLKRERARHSGSSCFGRIYSTDNIAGTIAPFVVPQAIGHPEVAADICRALGAGARPLKAGQNAIFSFKIGDLGTFSLHINGESVQVLVKGADRPDARFSCGLAEIAKVLNSGGNLKSLLADGGVRHIGNLERFLACFDFKKAQISFRTALESKQVRDCVPQYSRSATVAADAADLLADGKVIGWFQGGSEFGPRALGRRSILADPGKPGVRDFINSKIKFREDFRPFAPSVLREDVSQYFDYTGESPYMIVVAKVKPAWRERLVNVVHEDDSARIQTVTPEWNPLYYDLLREYKRRSGVSVLLNTSFNRRRMPIVETPADALSFFYECALDALIIGDHIVTK